MNRARQVVEIYRELKRSLEDGMSAAELLSCAAALLELHEAEGQPVFSLRTGGLPFTSLPIDSALADGGWRVLELESSGTMYDFDGEDARLDHIKRELLWRTWQ